jgi:hypothetical protein
MLVAGYYLVEVVDEVVKGGIAQQGVVGGVDLESLLLLETISH